MWNFYEVIKLNEPIRLLEEGKIIELNDPISPQAFKLPIVALVLVASLCIDPMEIPCKNKGFSAKLRCKNLPFRIKVQNPYTNKASVQN